MDELSVELLAVGAGPSNLALGVALEELAPPELASESLVIEQHPDIVWQRGLLLPWARTQVSFMKDLVTLRDPRSKFTFLNYLHSVGRLDHFVNMGTLTPYRLEVSDYLQWVAKSLTRPRIEYGRRCTEVEPVMDGTAITGWRVHMANDSTIRCRHLVLATGRDPHIPDLYANLPADRVVHSTGFSARLAELDPDRPRTVVVVGGAQSAAEMLWECHRTMPGAQCVMLMRDIGLRGYEHSKFTNELYFPSFVDKFNAAPPEIRGEVFQGMRATNYSALDPELLDAMYRQIYLEQVTHTERLHVRASTEVLDARADESGVVLTVLDRLTGVREELRCDLLMLGTGYDRRMPALVRGLAEAAGLDRIEVDRNYRLCAEGPATCHLQGVNEETHGIADSLLSVLGARSADIVTDLLTHREGTEP